MRKDTASADHSSRSSQPQHDDEDIDRDAAPAPHKISISVDSVADNVEKMTSKAVTFLDFLKGKIYASFQDNIPIDEIKEMPDPYWRNRLGMFSCALMVVVFLYFVISSELVAHRAVSLRHMQFGLFVVLSQVILKTVIQRLYPYSGRRTVPRYRSR
jgi:hypothetical protein